MAKEWKDNGAWVPLTPAKIACPGEDRNQNVENPQIHPSWGKLGHVENRGCEFGDSGMAEVVENHEGVCQRAEHCSCGFAAAKAGFMVSGNAGVSLESLGYSGTPEGTVAGFTVTGECHQTTEPLALSEGIQLHDNLNSTKASSLQKKQSMEMRSNKERPHKRRRIKKHRPKVFDETKPMKPSTMRPRTPGPSTLKPQTPRPSTSKPWAPRCSTPKPQVPGPSTPQPHTCRPKIPNLQTPSPPTPNPQTPRYVTSRHAEFVKNDQLNIPVNFLSDVGSSGPDKICSSRKVDSCMENQIVDLNSKVSDVEEKRVEGAPELHFDNGDACLQVSQRKRKLDFGMENCIVYQNSKACDGIENNLEMKPKLHSADKVNFIRVYQRRRKLNINKESGIMDQNAKTFKVYHRRRKLDLGLGNCTTDHNSRAPYVVEDKREVVPKLYPGNRRISRANECLNNSRKIGPNFPCLYKRNRMRQKKATAFEKFITLVKMTQTQRQRMKSLKMKSLTAGVSTCKLPREVIKNRAVHKFTLNASSKKRRTRISTRRRNLSCFIKGFHAKVNFKRKRSRRFSRRLDFSPFINFSTVQVSDAFLPKVRVKKNAMHDYKKHFLELDSGSLDEQRNELSRKKYFKEALIDYVCNRMESLHIHSRCTQLVVRDKSAQGTLVISKRRKPLPRVDLDEETIRVANLLMNDKWSEETEELDDEKKKYWEEQRAIFNGRLDSFNARMRLIHGDRQFSPWKGSVVDSVVGVFLTQNVSDILSSSAFMALAAKYPPPPPPSRSQESNCDEIKEIQHEKLIMSPSSKGKELFMMDKYPLTTSSNNVQSNSGSVDNISFHTESTPGKREENVKHKQENEINWDNLRTMNSHGRSRKRTHHNWDSVDWDAVRRAPVIELAKVIKERGMNNMLAARIKDFLDRIVRDHGSIDLEWLRDVPEDKAKEYLLSITGIGLKSVECVRLLSLQHHAFPVDTNVARVFVRLGWVPLQPLPGDIQIHLLNDYPMLDTIQKFLWPRLCKRPHPILYQSHCHTNNHAKLFCTKRNPNCNACPMKGDCRHFASAYASARLRLEGTRDKNRATESSGPSGHGPVVHANPQLLAVTDDEFIEGRYNSSNFEPIIEFPSSPDPVCLETLEGDMEDFTYEFGNEEIPTVKLNSEEFTEQVESFIREEGLSNALLSLHPEIASIPMPKLKEVARLRTVHHVYEIPDSHPLLIGFEKREPENPCPYLLAIWTADESTNSGQESRRGGNCQELACNSATCCSREIIQYQSDKIVQGTILIPCQTANRGRFPLNGTYFQMNEVFADHESSRNPIPVPRDLIWDLPRRQLYCGTSASSIAKGMSIEEIMFMCRAGFTCVRGFNRATREPKLLSRRFHVCKSRKVDTD